MKPEHIPAQIDEEADDGPEIGLIDMLTWVGEAKGRVALLTFAAAVLSVVVTLLMTPIYTARTTLTAPASQSQSGGSTAALSSALGSLSALSGLGTSLSGKTPDEMYVSILRSDSVLRGLDAQFELQKRFGLTSFETLRNVMKGSTRVTAEKKSGVIVVEVDDEDAKFAADLANGYATEVGKVLARMMLTEAQQRRAFFELQLKDAKDNLQKSEQSLRALQEKSGLIVPEKQAEAIIMAVSDLKTRIVAVEVELRVLRTSSTAANPDVQRLTAALNAMRSELARMETAGAIASAAAASGPSSGFNLPTSQLPAAAVELMRALREVKLQETLLANMVRQYETARLDVAKDAPSLQQIDVAQPPDRKAKPQRALIVLITTLVAMILASAWVVWRRYRALVNAVDPQGAQAWSTMTNAWRLRRKS
jgi:tyrosine-protein kinase Etk/Wzc